MRQDDDLPIRQSPPPPTQTVMDSMEESARDSPVVRAGITSFQALLILAAPIGVGAACAAHLLLAVVQLTTRVFYSFLWPVLAPIGRLGLVLVLVLGASLYAPLTRLVTPQARANGLPEVIYAVALRGGRMRLSSLMIDLISAAINIGAGGSVGQEGPVAEAGSGVASGLSQTLRLPPDVVRALVGCGTAGAIAATFDAPLAGAFFATEVVLRRATAQSLAGLLVAGVTGDLAGRSWFALTRPFPVPSSTWHGPIEIPALLVLGCLAGAASVMTVQGMHRSIALFERWTIPFHGKTLLGAALVGLLAAAVPKSSNDLPSAILGVGMPVVRSTVSGTQLALGLLIVLAIAKLIAFWLTIGSGGSGGVLGPCVFGGAMLGALCAHTMGMVQPGTGDQSLYAVVGMVALFGGAAQAPLTAVALAAELTGQVSMLVPAVLATVPSYILARRLERKTVYTLRLEGIGDTKERSLHTDDLRHWRNLS